MTYSISSRLMPCHTIRHHFRFDTRKLHKPPQSKSQTVALATEPWDEQRMDETVKQGPHKSAVEYANFLNKELLDLFVQKGFWMVLPYRLLKKYKKIFRNLQISPMGIVPQRAQRPRVIVDYSFLELSAETLNMAPRDTMQFGKAPKRILQAIIDADPAYGPINLFKVDIADGFYRIWLNTNGIPKLAVSLPALHGEEPLVALPLVLPMGWTESPQFFCAATETVTDVTNRRLANHWKPLPHRMDELASTESSPDDDNQRTNPMALPTSSTLPVATRPTEKYLSHISGLPLKY
jgi:hypothetical protein